MIVYYIVTFTFLCITKACQTIRRPPIYYADTVKVEEQVYNEFSQNNSNSPPPVYATLLEKHWEFESECHKSMHSVGLLHSGSTAIRNSLLLQNDEKNPLDNSCEEQNVDHIQQSCFVNSVKMSQIALLAEDTQQTKEFFPDGAKDINSQQIDLRRHNSWLLTLEDVSTPELAEVFAINAMAPCILVSKLKPMLLAKRSHIGNTSK